MGVNAISNEQVHARRAGCECPRMALGRRISNVGFLGMVSEALKASSKQAYTHSAARHTSESWYLERFLKVLDSGFRRNDELEMCRDLNAFLATKRVRLA